MIAGWLLAICGLAAASVGTWRGYVNAMDAVRPVVGERDPARSAEGSGSSLARARVRRLLRGAAVAVVWLVIAMYGLLLLTTAATVSTSIP